MTTTILGTVYEGRPMFGSLALRCHFMEEAGDAKGAQALLDAHNRIADVFGGIRPNLADDMTPVPVAGLLVWPAVRS